MIGLSGMQLRELSSKKFAFGGNEAINSFVTCLGRSFFFLVCYLGQAKQH